MTLVESGANALIPFTCRFENERWPDFLDRMDCRAAAARPKTWDAFIESNRRADFLNWRPHRAAV